MRRTSFSDMSCSIARSLEQIGEWWTLLIIREAFFGTRRFGAFQVNLGIAPNVLTQRLQDLVAHGILEVTASSENGRALDYGLTDKGRDLFPIIVALAQWGDRHAAAPEGPPVRIVERRNGEDIAAITLRSSGNGRALGLHEVTVAPGPGATPQQRAYFERLRQRQAEKAASREAVPPPPDRQDRADRKG
jgi:DNA-binding HxlR family transcriptional regulator